MLRDFRLRNLYKCKLGNLLLRKSAMGALLLKTYISLKNELKSDLVFKKLLKLGNLVQAQKN